MANYLSQTTSRKIRKNRANMSMRLKNANNKLGQVKKSLQNRNKVLSDVGKLFRAQSIVKADKQATKSNNKSLQAQSNYYASKKRRLLQNIVRQNKKYYLKHGQNKR